MESMKGRTQRRASSNICEPLFRARPRFHQKVAGFGFGFLSTKMVIAIEFLMMYPEIILILSPYLVQIGNSQEPPIADISDEFVGMSRVSSWLHLMERRSQQD